MILLRFAKTEIESVFYFIVTCSQLYCDDVPSFIVALK